MAKLSFEEVNDQINARIKKIQRAKKPKYIVVEAGTSNVWIYRHTKGMEYSNGYTMPLDIITLRNAHRVLYEGDYIAEARKFIARA